MRIVFAFAVLVLCGCRSPQAEPGRAMIAQYGCGSCHAIPGIAGAHGRVGPPLSGIADRQYVAGLLPNDASNLEKWIEDPHSVNPNTLMPNLGVSPRDASDISAYLYTLK